jgi:hypothetical protein
MKKRLSIVLSWWAFLHLMLIALTLILLEVVGVPQHDFPWFFEFYFDRVLRGERVIIFGLPIVVWIALWSLTGKPRVLPWNS